MPAAKPTKKVSRTRAKADKTTLLNNDRTLVIRFGGFTGRSGSFDDSVAPRPLVKSAEARLEFIGASLQVRQAMIVLNPFRFATEFRLGSLMANSTLIGPLSGN